jgi:hypothetical protein
MRFPHHDSIKGADSSFVLRLVAPFRRSTEGLCVFLPATVRIMRRFSEPWSMAHSPFGLESENLNSGFSTLPPEDDASLLLSAFPMFVQSLSWYSDHFKV